MPQLLCTRFSSQPKSIVQGCVQGISDMDSASTPATDLRLVIIVGQHSASGKSTTISRPQANLQPTPFAIDFSEIRKWHHQIDVILERDPIRARVLPTPSLHVVINPALLKHAQEAHYNLAIENTLTNPESVQRTIDSFRQQGYRTMIVALAVPEQLSWSGLKSRTGRLEGLPGLGAIVWRTALAGQSPSLSADDTYCSASTTT